MKPPPNPRGPGSLQNKVFGVALAGFCVGVFFYCTRAVKQGGISATDLERYKAERAITAKAEK